MASAESTVLACLIVTITTAGFFLSSSQFNHWFVIPVAICGVLVGTDAIGWVRGRLGLYDPVGIIGLFGFHFFFLAPLLHVKWNLWIGEVNGPPDWRDWLGYMAILNVVGLIGYRFCYKAVSSRGITKPHKTFWQIDKGLFRVVAPVCLTIAAAAQIWVYASMGGIGAFMQAVQEHRNALQGMGWVFMISESVPILATFLIVVYFQQRKMSSSKIIGTLMALFIVQMVFAGLRGSRSETLDFLFCLVGCIHFLVRPVPRKLVYAGAAFLLAFLYFYAFYKAGGVNGINQAFSGSEQREVLSQKSGRSFRGVVLGDLGRADVQAFILYKLATDPRDFRYAKGRTYLGALALVMPRSLFPHRPESKLKEGTEILYGAGEYTDQVKWSSRVYGLAGECMLNFSPVAVPFVYAIFGLFVGWVRTYVARLLPGDSRFLLMPMLVLQCFAALIGDSDNLVFSAIKDGFMPALVVIVCSTRRRQFVPPRPLHPGIAPGQFLTPRAHSVSRGFA